MASEHYQKKRRNEVRNVFHFFSIRFHLVQTHTETHWNDLAKQNYIWNVVLRSQYKKTPSFVHIEYNAIHISFSIVLTKRISRTFYEIKINVWITMPIRSVKKKNRKKENEIHSARIYISI